MTPRERATVVTQVFTELLDVPSSTVSLVDSAACPGAFVIFVADEPVAFVNEQGDLTVAASVAGLAALERRAA